MTLLPIVERELRVASRKRLTFWGRLGAAAFALLVFGCLQLLAELSRGTFKAGQLQFICLKWLCFLFACSAGLFLTSDALSEEKRDGTLGLLFLTDLRGYDVVFGKLISHSLRAFYGLLAAFPIVGLAILAGGVAGAEFWRVILLIANTLFLSLSIGLFVSSLSRDVMKAINGTLLLGLVVMGGLPLADLCLAWGNTTTLKPVLSLFSPWYAFVQIGPFGFPDYWLCFGLQNGLAWALLILSCICTPRAWQEKSNTGNSSRTTLAQWWRFGSAAGRLQFRRRALEREPVFWLAARDRWLPRFVWGITALVLGFLVWATLQFWGQGAFQFTNYALGAFGLGMLLWVASQASRFFVDGIRTGALELILVTPVGPERVVRSQWSALWRTYLVPVLVLLAFQTAASIGVIYETQMRMRGAKFSANLDYYGTEIATIAVEIIKFTGNLVAVVWFGMWMGITTRKVSYAVLKTLAFTIVLPAMAIGFIQMLVMFVLVFSITMNGGMPSVWLGIAFGGVLSLAKNAFFVWLARRRLLADFRGAMLRETRPVTYVPLQVPPQPPPSSAPPIIIAGSGTG